MFGGSDEDQLDDVVGFNTHQSVDGSGFNIDQSDNVGSSNDEQSQENGGSDRHHQVDVSGRLNIITEQPYNSPNGLADDNTENNNFIGDDLRGDENQNFKFEYDELQVGLSFTSYDAACDYIKNWTDSNKLPLVKRDTSRGNEKTPGRLLFECPHAIKRRYKSKGAREKRSVNYTACNSRVNIYESKRDGVFRVTLCIKEHDGHLTGEAVYGSYPTVRAMTPTTKQKIMQLESVGASRRRVADLMSENTGI